MTSQAGPTKFLRNRFPDKSTAAVPLVVKRPFGWLLALVEKASSRASRAPRLQGGGARGGRDHYTLANYSWPVGPPVEQGSFVSNPASLSIGCAYIQLTPQGAHDRAYAVQSRTTDYNGNIWNMDLVNVDSPQEDFWAVRLGLSQFTAGSHGG